MFSSQQLVDTKEGILTLGPLTGTNLTTGAGSINDHC